MKPGGPIGVLLLNIGTPASPEVRDVRRYLREFLGDPRVIDLPAPLRWLLLHGVILPFRPRRSAAAYASIWTDRGSPLRLHTRALRDALAEELGKRYVVTAGMRYGTPSIEEAFAELGRADVERVVVFPLFPQYSASATGSALHRTFEVATHTMHTPELHTVGPFYDQPGFVSALAEVTRPSLDAFGPDHVVMSYHGLPKREIRKTDPTGRRCLVRATCCLAVGPDNRGCYRAQCFATSRALAAALDLPEERYTVSFQSRLGPTRWIRPYTDVVLGELPKRGVRRIAVVCPSFVADCLETLEEIGIRGREQFREGGGEELLLVPCLNAEGVWVRTAAELVRGSSASQPRLR